MPAMYGTTNRPVVSRDPRCWNCGDFPRTGDTMTGALYGSETVMCCPRCYGNRTFACTGCTERHVNSEAWSFDGATFCRECQRARTRYCDGCESTVRTDTETAHRCRPGIRGWDYRPNYVVRGQGGQPTFGVELEVGVQTRYAADITELGGGVLYCKRDGSVYCTSANGGGDGTEIVTHPMTLEWFKANFPFEVMDFVRANGGVNRSCGLHIHAGLDGIGRSPHTGFTLAWLWNYDVDYTRAICRRQGNSYARNMAQSTMLRWFRDGMGYRPSGRYFLTNFSSPHGTVEFRGFASTSHRAQLEAAVEFVASTIEFAKQWEGQPQHVTWLDYAGWLFKHGETYPAALAEWFRREANLIGLSRADQDLMRGTGLTNRQRASRARYRDAEGRFAPRPAESRLDAGIVVNAQGSIVVNDPAVIVAAMSPADRELLGLDPIGVDRREATVNCTISADTRRITEAMRTTGDEINRLRAMLEDISANSNNWERRG